MGGRVGRFATAAIPGAAGKEFATLKCRPMYSFNGQPQATALLPAAGDGFVRKS
jgi:hypothetical protein